MARPHAFRLMRSKLGVEVASIIAGGKPSNITTTTVRSAASAVACQQKEKRGAYAVRDTLHLAPRRVKRVIFSKIARLCQRDSADQA